MNGIIGRYETYNAFDYDNPTILNGYIDSSGNFVSYVTNGVVVIPISVGKQYDISGLVRYNPTVICRYGLFNTIPTHMTSSIRYGEYQQGNTTSITAETNENYLIIIFCGDSDYNQYGSVQAAYSANCINFHVDTENWNDIPYTRLETATDAVTTLPVTTYNDGTNATVAIKGNMQQSGTPTPTSQITPSECGERTENLLEIQAVTRKRSDITFTINDDKSVTLTGTATALTYSILMGDGAGSNNLNNYSTPIFRAGDRLIFSTDTSIKLQARYTDGTYYNKIPNNQAITLAKDVGLIYVQVANGETRNITIYPMVRQSTSTSSEYEPYGYKLPVISGNTTTNIYLSEPLRKIGDYADTIAADGTVTRTIKTYKITGQENWGVHGSIASWFFADNIVYPIIPTDATLTSPTITSHFKVRAYAYAVSISNGECTFGHPSGNLNQFRIIMKNTDYTTVEDFTDWLKAQYNNGNPVTIWYASDSPTTETITVPSIPTTSGGQTFDVDTTLKPSEVSLTYHGWHEHEAEKRENGSWT